jgi:hypothetical protein
MALIGVGPLALAAREPVGSGRLLVGGEFGRRLGKPEPDVSPEVLVGKDLRGAGDRGLSAPPFSVRHLAQALGRKRQG